MSLLRTLVLAGVTVVAVSSLAQAERLQVTISALNVRSGPSTRFRVITVARRNQAFDVLGRSGNWRKVRTGAGEGWLYSRGYTRVVASTTTPPSTGGTTEQCIVVRVNVRTGPSTRNTVLGSLTRGQRVQVIGREGSWKRITFNGRTAYAWAAYLGPVSGTTPPPAVPAPSRPVSRAGFIQMPANGRGFRSYAVASKRWGRPQLVTGMERAAARWAGEGHRDRIRVGNISRENGGYMFPHVSHRYGKNMDVAPIRNDGVEGPVTRFSRRYDRARTARVLALLRSEVRARSVLFNDRGVPGVRYWPGHDNHFHYTIN